MYGCAHINEHVDAEKWEMTRGSAFFCFSLHEAGRNLYTLRNGFEKNRHVTYCPFSIDPI